MFLYGSSWWGSKRESISIEPHLKFPILQYKLVVLLLLLLVLSVIVYGFNNNNSNANS